MTSVVGYIHHTDQNGILISAELKLTYDGTEYFHDSPPNIVPSSVKGIVFDTESTDDLNVVFTYSNDFINLEYLVFRQGSFKIHDKAFNNAGAGTTGAGGDTDFTLFMGDGDLYITSIKNTSFDGARINNIVSPSLPVAITSDESLAGNDGVNVNFQQEGTFINIDFFGAKWDDIQDGSFTVVESDVEPQSENVGEIWFKQGDSYQPSYITIKLSDDELNYTITPAIVESLFPADAWEGDIVAVVFDDYKIAVSDDAFVGCTYLESLIFRGTNVTLGTSCFENAGMWSGTTGPNSSAFGVTIFYKYNASGHLYDNNAFKNASISEFLIPQTQIYVGPSELLAQPSQLTTFFGSNTPGPGSGEASIPVTFSTTPPPTCFVAGTMINTDQGVIAIEEITTSNTIRGMSICRVTKRLSKNNLVLVKKDAFGVNRPNKNTISTHWHGVYLKDSDKEFVRLINLVDNKKVIEQYYKFEYVYNIELKDKHSYMHANNLKVETLIPGHD